MSFEMLALKRRESICETLEASSILSVKLSFQAAPVIKDAEKSHHHFLPLTTRGPY